MVVAPPSTVAPRGMTSTGTGHERMRCADTLPTSAWCIGPYPREPITSRSMSAARLAEALHGSALQDQALGIGRADLVECPVELLPERRVGLMRGLERMPGMSEVLLDGDRPQLGSDQARKLGRRA